MGETLFQRVLELFYGTMTFECLGFFRLWWFFTAKQRLLSASHNPNLAIQKKVPSTPTKQQKGSLQFVQPQKKQQETLTKWKKNTNPSYIHIHTKCQTKKTWTFSRHLWHSKNKTTTTQGASESLRPNSSAAFRTPKSDRWPARTAPRSCAHRGPSQGDRCV